MWWRSGCFANYMNPPRVFLETKWRTAQNLNIQKNEKHFNKKSPWRASIVTQQVQMIRIPDRSAEASPSCLALATTPANMPGKAKMTVQIFGSLSFHGRHRGQFRLLPSRRPNPDFCGHWGDEPMDRRSLSFLSLSYTSCLSNKWVFTMKKNHQNEH